ncbi:hypothetical protein [Pseudomonas sp. AF32]|uniref:hypothetical protein n=1 Tax=Pseudomonas sp. AF32 TaxID=554390 RepID=UPI001EED9121|nr:hypothetical protein [Pseudomonas sp. AF32]
MEHLLWWFGGKHLDGLVDYQDGLADGVLSTANPTSGDRSSYRSAFQSNLCPHAILH